MASDAPRPRMSDVPSEEQVRAWINALFYESTDDPDDAERAILAMRERLQRQQELLDKMADELAQAAEFVYASQPEVTSAVLRQRRHVEKLVAQARAPYPYRDDARGKGGSE